MRQVAARSGDRGGSRKMGEETLRVPYSRPSIGAEEEAAVLDVLRSGWLTTGKWALQFEKDFAHRMNACRVGRGSVADDRTALAVNSNTSGMMLAMEALGVGPGTAVVTTPYTFVSTAACAAKLGADVIFCDIEKDSYNIDSKKVEEAVKADRAGECKVRAIVPVHVGGNVCDMEHIMQIARKYDVKVIEDAAHAFPSPTRLGMAGAIGDCGVFSFYVTKTITTGEGGMVCVKDSNVARRIETMRMHGMDRTTWDRYTSPRASWEYDIVADGWKFNLPDVLAAIGVEQLKKADIFYEKRKKIAMKYNEAFAECDFITPPPDGEGNAWHIYFLRIKAHCLDIGRDEVAKLLQQRGVGISVHFIPLFHFTYWQQKYSDFRADAFPNAEERYRETISLPLWPDMTEEMTDFVIKTVLDIGREHRA